MSPVVLSDLYLVLGGALGAGLRQATDPAKHTFTWQTLQDMAMAGAAMVLITASGVVPDDAKAIMLANPIRTIAMGLIAGPGSMSLVRAALKRFGLLNGESGGTPPPPNPP